MSMPEDLEVFAAHSYSASSSNTALCTMRMCWRPWAMISYFFPFLISLPSFNQRTCRSERKKSEELHLHYLSKQTNGERELTLASSLETSHSNLADSFSLTSTSWSGFENSTCGAVNKKVDVQVLLYKPALVNCHF